MKLDILAFGAHPDDVELAASGTIARHLALGYRVGIIDLTRGELGTRGTPEIRSAEASASSSILGIHVRENLGMKDGFFVKDENNLIEIIRMIRAYQPELVLANAVSDRHVDHGKAADLVQEACFLSGLRKIETSFQNKIQDAWRPKQVLHYIQDYYIKPDLIVDITPYFETKMKSISAFSSQFYNPEADEPETAISGKDFLQFIEARARQFGRLIGTTYGEGFTVRRPPGVSNLLELS